MQTGRNAPFVEPIAVPDIFASELGRIENMGDGMMRFTYFVWQQSLIDGSMERVVVARIVRPICTLRDNLLDVVAAIEAASVNCDRPIEVYPVQ